MGSFFSWGVSTTPSFGFFFFFFGGGGGLREISWDFVGFSKCCSQGLPPPLLPPMARHQRKMRDSGSLEERNRMVSEQIGDFCTSVADLEGALQQSDGF